MKDAVCVCCKKVKAPSKAISGAHRALMPTTKRGGCIHQTRLEGKTERGGPKTKARTAFTPQRRDELQRNSELQKKGEEGGEKKDQAQDLSQTGDGGSMMKHDA